MNLIKKIFNGSKKKTELPAKSEHITEKEKKSEPKESTQFNRNFKIITARPDGMSFAEYKAYLKKQGEWLKKRKSGFLVYKSIEWFDRELENEKGKKEKTKVARHYGAFIGSVKYDLVNPV